MTARSDIALIDRLRLLPAETEWLEWKRNHLPPPVLGELVCALANSACLAHQDHGWLIFGVDDATHDVVGTAFDPFTAKGKGNQDLLPWLTSLLEPNPGVDVRIVEHPRGRCVLFDITPASQQPVRFAGTAYIRVGSSTTALRKHPAKERAIWARGRDWSAEVCERAALADLDPEAIARARRRFAERHPAQAAEVATWNDLTFLNKARLLQNGSFTNAAVVLLGLPESASLISPAEAKISWILKDAQNRELDFAHFFPPFLFAGDLLQQRVRNLTVRFLPADSLAVQEVAQYDPWVLREALHNCIAHQDYTRCGRIVVVEFPDRVLFVNVGDFLPGDVETVIRQDAPQPVYRNRFLAQAMVELGLIETQGGGIKRMFVSQRQRWFPLPDYDLGKPGEVRVTITGRIVDERYTQWLLARPDLDLEHAMLLDRVQKKRPISKDQHRRLKVAGLVEGRFPNLIVSAVVASITGDVARHIRESGFDDKYYLDLIMALVGTHGPVDRKTIDDLLLSKLPDRLNPEQKMVKVQNLVQRLRREGRIANRGTRTQPAWVVADPDERR